MCNVFKSIWKCGALKQLSANGLETTPGASSTHLATMDFASTVKTEGMTLEVYCMLYMDAVFRTPL